MDSIVSIIMPTYNRAHIISRAIESVLAQTYGEFELIVINDGSTDDTERVISEYTDNRIHAINLRENKGACYARNQGIDISQGDFIAFLDSDNEWDVDYLENRIRFINKCEENVGAVFGSTRVIRKGESIRFPSDEVCKRLKEYSSNEQYIKEMLYGNVIDTNTILLKRDALCSIGGFNESLKRLQDWEYFFRVLLQSKYGFVFSDDCLVTNYVLCDSLGNNNQEYWKSLCYFFEEYKDEFIKRDVLFECICHQLTNQHISGNEQDIKEFISSFEEDEKNEILIRMRKQCIEKSEDLAEIWNSMMKGKRIRGVLEKWIMMKQKGDTLEDAFLRKGCEKIIIFGYGALGKLLVSDLSNGKCNVLGIVDKNLKASYIDNIPVLKPMEDLGDADGVIVTAITDFNNIKKEYEKEIQFISLEDFFISK